MKLPAVVLEEPDLIFANQGVEQDPRVGLDLHGPFHLRDEPGPSPNRVRIGVVATGRDYKVLKEMFEYLSEPIDSTNSNKWLSPDFPGFNQDTSVECEFLLADAWFQTIRGAEERRVVSIKDVNQRIAECANMYADKVGVLAAEDGGPHVVICVLSNDIEKLCGRSDHTRGASRRKKGPARGRTQQSLAEWVDGVEELQEDFDLHHAMKGKTMRHEVPLQLIKNSTLRTMTRMMREGSDPPPGSSLQQASEFAWNFSTALYYKASGRPWRLAKLTPGTCYIGIAFFEDLRAKERGMGFSMAQVFTHSLEGFVIRGTKVEKDRRTKTYHMSEDQTRSLVEKVLEKYEMKAGHPPGRVVVHKTSFFSDAEAAGIKAAVGDRSLDLVSFGRGKARFLRQGRYPALRGTLISLSDRKHLLYASGYTPRLRTYPGPRVPEPLLITHDGDSDIDLVSREILGLTKLDWNTAAFSKRLPITIGFSKRVGRVLSELRDDKGIQDEYRFYM